MDYKVIIKNKCDELNLIELNENILTIDCSNNNIQKIINFPSKLKELICIYNNIKYFENLPNTLRYLDCWSNPIENLDYLPNSLLVLRCSNCILPLNNLPNSLLELECETCLINLSTLSTLPNLKYLKIVNCSSENNSYQLIPKNISKLIIDNSPIKINLDVIPTNLYYFYCNKENIVNLIYNSKTINQNLLEFTNNNPNLFFTSEAY
jgi:hypothetical protein